MSTSATRLYEYSAAAAVELTTQPAVAFLPSLHTGTEPSAVIPLDLSKSLGGCTTPATSPNLLASFLRLQPDTPLKTEPRCSSQVFYVIRGKGCTTGASCGAIEWEEGDCFTFPGTEGPVLHSSSTPSSLYWVHDEPLLRYLGVTASSPPRFIPALYKSHMVREKVEEIRHQPAAEGRNRM